MPIQSTPSSASHLYLTINGGSSSVKFAVFAAGAQPQRVFSGQLERIGTAQATLSATVPDGQARSVAAMSFREAVQCILAFLEQHIDRNAIVAVGHRIVHGGAHLLQHAIIQQSLIDELHRMEPLDLAHLPREIALIESFMQAFGGIPQVACFDTAFHRDMPRVAQLLPIPRKYLESGLRRFGFHGLSYTYLLSELERLAGKQAAHGRVLFAHLGSGASMAAVRDGKPIDTTMGFTPTSGLMMGTRPGDMDAGLCVYLMQQEKLTTEQMDKFIAQQCGLIGVSQTSADMRDLIAASVSDIRAREAVDLFCYSAVKQAAGLVAAMGGLQTIVFSGGIGEHSPEVRQRIGDGLAFLGVKLDASKNAAHAPIISTEESAVEIRVIPTDEEIVIARIIASLT